MAYHGEGLGFALFFFTVVFGPFQFTGISAELQAAFLAFA